MSGTNISGIDRILHGFLEINIPDPKTNNFNE
jgi:hypothetical protein